MREKLNGRRKINNELWETRSPASLTLTFIISIVLCSMLKNESSNTSMLQQSSRVIFWWWWPYFMTFNHMVFSVKASVKINGPHLTWQWFCRKFFQFLTFDILQWSGEALLYCHISSFRDIGNLSFSKKWKKNYVTCSVLFDHEFILILGHSLIQNFDNFQKKRVQFGHCMLANTFLYSGTYSERV